MSEQIQTPNRFLQFIKVFISNLVIIVLYVTCVLSLDSGGGGGGCMSGLAALVLLFYLGLVVVTHAIILGIIGIAYLQSAEKKYKATPYLIMSALMLIPSIFISLLISL